jgi:hypothetical protein
MSESFQMRVGDWSHDGHGHTDDIFVTTELTLHDVSQALDDMNALLSKVCGDDFSTICEDYEDNRIPRDMVEALKDMGVNVDNLDEDDDYYRTYSQDFMHLIIDSLNVFKPELGLKADKKMQPPVLDVGGYGLFWD